MRRYLPCVVFALVVCTASARPQVPLGQDPFGASAPVGGNTGGVPLSAVTGGEIPLGPLLDEAGTVFAGDGSVFGPTDAGTVGLASLNDPFAGSVGLASLDDPFAGTGFSNDLTFGPQAAPVLPSALAASPAAAQTFAPAPAQDFNPFSVPVFTPTSNQVPAPASVPLSDPVIAPSSPDIADQILSGPVFVPLPAQGSDLVLAPSSPDIANEILSGPVLVPLPASAPASDPVLAPSSPDIADQILSGPVFVPLPAQDSFPASDPFLAPSSPDIADQILPGPVNVPLPIQEQVSDEGLRLGSSASPAGAPSYYPSSQSTGSNTVSAPVAPPGITMITKANLVFTAFDVSEVDHARDAALAAAVAGSTGSAAPTAPVSPVDPSYSISIDPILLSDAVGTSARASVASPASVPAGFDSGLTQEQEDLLHLNHHHG